MATLPELEDALRNADAAGDTAAAQQLADEIVRMRGAGAAQPAAPQPTMDDFLNGTGAFGEPGAAGQPNMDAPAVPAGTPDKRLPFYAQKLARIPADLVGALPDVTNLFANQGLQYADQIGRAFGADGVDFRFPSASDAIADTAASIYEGAGGEIVRPDEVPPEARAFGEAMRFGGGAAAGGGLLTGVSRAGRMANAPNAVRRVVEPLAAPYATSNPAKTIIGDALTGGGAGYAGQSYRDNVSSELQESIGPIGEVIASLIGGVGASTIDAAGRGITNAALSVPENIIKGKRDFNLPVNPETGLAPRRVDVEEAARTAQQMPSDLHRATRNIEDGAAEFGKFARPEEMPTVGMLADDIGMASNEVIARQRDRVPFLERDANREALASRKLDSVTPEGDGRAFTERATRIHDGEINTARHQVFQAEQRQAAAGEEIAAHQAELNERRVRQPEASTRLAGEVDTRLDELQNEKNRRFQSVPDDTVIPGEPIKQELDAVNRGVPEMARTGSYAANRGALNERLRGDPVLDADGNPTGDFETRDVTYGDLRAARAQISKDRTAEVTGGGSPEFLDRVGGVVNRQVDEANPDAAEFYRETFVPQAKTGEMGEYYNARKRANRTGEESSATRPSETAGRFLKTPEGASRLPALRGTRDVDFPQGDATDWMLGELAKRDVLSKDGNLRYDRFKRWADDNKAVIDQFPEMRKRIDGELDRARKGGLLSKQLADEVAAAKVTAEATERNMQRSALAHAVGTDPERAVGKIMGSSDPERQMAEMVERLKDHTDATEGLKTAVRDWIIEKKGDTKSIIGHGDLRHVNAASLRKLLNSHEKTLAKLYTPEEMNTLRQVDALASAPKKLDVKVTAGSDTQANIQAEMLKQAKSLGKVQEAALKLWFGMLRGGGINRGINVALETLPNNQAEVERIVKSMWLDPRVAGHLLKMPVRDRDIPAWNAKLNRMLSLASGGRDLEDDQKPLAKDVEK